MIKQLISRAMFIGMLATTSAQALTIDAEKYFAYVYVPASSFDSDHYILLSRELCDIKDIGGGKVIWYKAIYQNDTRARYGILPVPGCWGDFNVEDKAPADNHYVEYFGLQQVKDYIVICENHYIQSCKPASKSRFINTATLPKQADF